MRRALVWGEDETSEENAGLGGRMQPVRRAIVWVEDDTFEESLGGG